VVVPLLIGYIKRPNFKSEEKAWLYLITLSFLIEVSSLFLKRHHMNNLYIYHIYTVIEFICISFFFIRIISKTRFILLIKTGIVLFLGVALFDLISNGYKEADNLSTTTESIVFILYASFFFYFLLKNPTYMNVLATPVFWLNTAVLIYFSGNLFLFIFSNYLEDHSPRIYFELWGGIHSVLNILFYSLISIAFWKTKQQ
jgi:hypothetical protein